jgi:hypothetical protein
MIPVIISKLRAELASSIDTEVRVVYLLANIRKILEQENSNDNFKYLKFHCNWALHSCLDRDQLAKEILDNFNQIHVRFLSGIDLPNLPSGLREQIEIISKMENFRKELSCFLQAHKLPDIITGRPDCWPRFLLLYAAVVEDCPLIFTQETGNASIIKVILSLENAEQLISDQYYFKIIWNIHGKQGEKGELFVINSYSSPQSALN